MPSVFGIIQSNLKQPDPALMKQMAEAATYLVPRQMTTLDAPGISAVAALRKDFASINGNTSFFRGRDLVIAADAGLYNQKELAYRLGINTTREQAGDAELILLAYEKWGSHCPAYLYGDFAFVIFNTASGEIFIGRDPLGVRPIFYLLQHDLFIFSSELRMVLAAQDKPAEISREYLLDSLVGVKTAKDKTSYESILRLPPGHYLEYKNGEVKTTRYWMPDANATIDLKNDREYIDMFRELLVNAVNMRCKGVASLGSELSGGLDSSAVTGIAADYVVSNKMPFTTFSNVFPEGTGIEFKDEREFIREMLSFKGLSGVNIDGNGMTITDLLKYTLDIQGTYVQQNYNMMNYGLLKAAGEKGVHVLLSGFGGDELVSARTAFPWNEMIENGQWNALQDELFYRGVTPKTLLKPGVIAARYLYSRLRKQEFSTGPFTPELLAKRLQNLPLQQDYIKQHDLGNRMRDKYKFPKQDTLSLRQLFRISMEHLPQRMEYCYAAAAQFGIEYRYPLLDVNLVLACLAFPARLKKHHGINRYLFRESITGFVPEIIRQRDDKSGTTIPHTYYSLISDKEGILSLVRDCRGVQPLEEIFALSLFPRWHEKLVMREKEELNHLNPGAFYTYLMMLMYYRRDKGRGTRD